MSPAAQSAAPAAPALDGIDQLEQLEGEARREVKYRRHVYGKRVAEGKMSQKAADTQIARMEQIVTLLAELRRPHAALVLDTTPAAYARLGLTRQSFVQPAEICAVLANPDGFRAHLGGEEPDRAQAAREAVAAARGAAAKGAAA